MISWYRPRNLVQVIQTWARKKSQQPALLFLGNGEEEIARLTYGELDLQARRIATFLQTQQLVGKPVILLYPTGLEFICAYMGCLYAGCIAVPCSCPSPSEFTKSIASVQVLISNSEAKTVLTLSDYVPFLKAFRSNELSVFDTNTMSHDVQHYKQAPINENDISHLQYTSGSTSAPKGVITRHKNLIASIQNHIRSWDYDKKSVTLCWAPHSHVYGLLGGLLVPLFHGSLGIIMPAAEFIKKPSNWLRALSKYRVSHSGGPNFSYDLCVQRIQPNEIEGIDLSCWNVALVAGEPVQYQTLHKFFQAFRESGFRQESFCSAYGMSETTGLIAATKPQRALTIASLDRFDLLNNEVNESNDGTNARQVISSGDVAGLNACIVDPNTLALQSNGAIGELWLSGDTICSGYWNQLEESTPAFNNKLSHSPHSYLRTGDLGYIKNGELFLTGRLKEVIILYGKKYYPADIEMVASEITKSSLADCSNIVFSIEKEGKENVILVQEIPQKTAKDKQYELMREIRQAVTEHLKIDLYGIALIEKQRLPRTSSGKLSRQLAKTYFIENKFNYLGQYFKEEKKSSPLEPNMNQMESGSASVLDHFNADLMDIIAKELNIPRHEMNINDSLSKYGFDSINIASFVANLNNTFGLTLTPANLFEYKTLNDISTDLLEQHAVLFGRYYASKAPQISQVADTSALDSKIDKHDKTFQDIAVIGMNGIFPGSADLDVFWRNLIEQKDLISEIPSSRWDWRTYYDGKDSKTKLQWGGFIDGVDLFDAKFFSISPVEAELMDPQQRVFLEVVWNTIENSGYSVDELAKKKTGLFVGVSASDYREMVHKTQKRSPYLITGVYHSLLPNRISYLLNLSGTSEAIDTACSSSLVAIHHAIKAIQYGDCELAIAGGVNINLLPDLFLTFSNAGMLCEDGRCKTFDKSANGYVRGEGAGAILLKPLTNALADGDIIYAIIKGSAVNHGGHVNSMTVPNPNAQADVIVEACERAKVDIETIDYIEAHGTGTPLGDPIEINGLKKAFKTVLNKQNKAPSKTNYCGVGSVKTNIGHLEPAAGIAGVIKVLLALQHGQIPGQVNFKELNPFIELHDSPFYIANKNQPWPPCKDNESPRRAGVSSFGIGGSNAHIILEEFVVPQQNVREAFKPAYLITLSAKSLLALQQKSKALEDWLLQEQHMAVNQHFNLEHISYTLNKGRGHFDYRYAFIVNSIPELGDRLARINKGGLLNNITKQTENSLSQDEHIQTIQKELDSTLLSVDEYRSRLTGLADLYMQGYNLDWDKLHRNESHRKISLPVYPFNKQRYWLETADLMEDIPSNIIQFTGKEFYFTDHLINQIPTLPGVMYLNLINQVAGTPITSIKQLVFNTAYTNLHAAIKVDLGDSGKFVISSRSEPSSEPVVHAEGSAIYGSGSTDNTIINIADILARCRDKRTHEEIYTQFSMNGILYGPAFRVIEEIYHNEHEAIARLSLPTFLLNDDLLHPSLFDGALQSAVSLLHDDSLLFLPFSIEEINIYRPLMSVCYAYVKKTKTNNRDMPKYDIDIIDEQGNRLIHVINFALRAIKKPRNTASTVYYHPVWQQKPLISISNQVQMTRPIVIIDESDELITTLKDKLPQLKLFHLLPNQSLAEYQQVFTHFNTLPGYIIYHQKAHSSLVLSPLKIQQQLEQSLYTFFHLTQSLLAQKPTETVHFLVVNEQEESISSLFAEAFAGFAKTIQIEQPRVLARLISRTASSHHNIDQLLAELAETDIEVRYDQEGIRWVKQFTALKIPPEVSTMLPIKKGGIYLITGGMGGLGLIFAKYLAAKYQAKLILTGRSILNEQQQNSVVELERLNSDVMYIQGDIAQQEHVEKVIQQIKARFGSLNGIIHSAGVIQDNFIIKKNLSEITSVITPKIDGTLYLDQLTQSEPLDFFVMFSSIASILGNSGQCDYAYANCFMDNFAVYREQLRRQNLRHGLSISINWPLWVEGGMHIDDATIEWLKQTYGMELLPTDQGLKSFEFALSSALTQLIVLSGDKIRLEQLWSMPVALPKSIKSNQTTVSVDNDLLIQKTEHYLKEILAAVAKIPLHELDTKEHFEKYGIDSLMIVSLNQRLEQSFENLPKTLFFEYNSLDALSHYFIANHTDALIKKFALTPSKTNVREEQFIPEATKENASTTFHSEDIAIIGLSGQYPMANDLEIFWDNLKSGKDCITEIPETRWDYRLDYDADKNKEGKSYSKWGGFIEDVDKFDALFFNISPYEAALIDPQERLFLETAWKTIEDAGYSKETLSEQSIGVYVGVMYGHYQLYGEDETLKGHPMATISSYASIANRISYFLNLHGPSLAVDTMCSSSITSIHLACQSIRNGECVMAIAGGVNVSIHPNKYIALSQGQFVSTDGRCRSFGEGGDGYVPSEGVGAILLKPLSQALKDKDHIYGVIKGSSLNHGGKTNSYTVPSPTAQARVISAAFKSAAVNPATISYLETHGTGTSLGDPIEIAGLTKVFALPDRTTPYPIGSVKSNIGHCESAAGIAAITKVLLQIQHQQLVPSLHSETLNPNINWADTPFKVQQQLTDWDAEYKIAGISSFGAGGSNAHIIIAQPPAPAFYEQPPSKSNYLITLSGKTEAALNNRILNLSQWLEKQSHDRSLEDISYTLNHGRSHFEKRCAIVVSSITELRETLMALQEHQTLPNVFLVLDKKDTLLNQAVFKKLFVSLMREVNDVQRLSSGEYRDTLLAIANFYVDGYQIDWDRLHANEAHRKMSLPTYPFERERHWVKQSAATNMLSTLHPLLDTQIGISKAQCFTKQFNGTEFYLQDHQINNRAILPAAAYLEMARAAGEFALPDWHVIGIHNVIWMSPIEIHDTPLTITMSLYPGEMNVAFEVTTKAERGGFEPTVHAQGQLIFSSPNDRVTEPVPLNINDIQQRHNKHRIGEQVYADFKTAGFVYGPAFQVIESVSRNQNELLASLKLPEFLSSNQQFILHPSLLDGVLQATAELMHEDRGMYLPFSLGKLTIYAKLPTTIFVYATINPGVMPAFQIQVTDEDGKVVLVINDFRVRVVQERKETRVQEQLTAPLGKESITNVDDHGLERLAQQTKDFLKTLLSKVISLAPEHIKSNATFESYGIDSVMIVKLNRMLEETFGDLSKTLFFEYATVNDLTHYFVENHSEVLLKKFNLNNNAYKEQTQHESPIVKSIVSPLPLNPFITVSDIAIIGMSGRYPQANNLDDFWENLKAGKDSISEIPSDRWDYHIDYDPDKTKAGKTYSKWGGFINNIDKFDPLFFNISPKEAELMDPQERLFLETAWNTIEDAGYPLHKLAKKHIGVFVGAMYSEYQLFGVEETLKGHVAALSSSHASIANRVSYYLNFHGPSIALDTMCSSSLTAIHLACKSLRDGECQMALAGGVNLSIHPNKYILLSQGKFLASDGHCHSFGEGGDGYVPGEGVGSVLLKPLQNALEDGDRIYAVIKGSSINHGGRTNGYTIPSPIAQDALIEDNFRRTGVNPDTISYVEAHGTGTSLGDPIEINGLSKAFGQEPRETPVPIGSVKSNIGHLESAAGIAAIAKVLLQMQHQALVPSLFSEILNTNINWEKTPFKVQHEFSEWKRPYFYKHGIQREIPRRAGISSFGAGGSNAHLIIEEAPDVAPIQNSHKPAYLLTLSAKNIHALQQKMSDLSLWLDKHGDAVLETVCYTLNAGRNHFDKRAAFIATNIDELKYMLLQAQETELMNDYFIGDAAKKPDDTADDEQVLAPVLADLTPLLELDQYKTKLAALADLYVQGYDPDWDLVHQGESQRIISLPTYPFAKERYWIPDPSHNELKKIHQAAPGLHPLLDTNVSTIEKECFRKLFTGNEFYLTDHLVNNRSVLPATAYLEMARAAGQFAAPTQLVIGLRNILFATPVQVVNKPIEVTIGIYPDATGVGFDVCSMNDEEQLTHAQGKIVYSLESFVSETLDIAELQNRCNKKMVFEEIYANFKEYGLHYGSGFKVLQYIMSNDAEAVAKIQLPESLNNTFDSYMLHPSILDGALQAISGLEQNNADEEKLYLPFSIGEVDLFDALTNSCYAYITKSPESRTDLTKFQIQITDASGKILVKMRDVSFRLMQTESVKNSQLSFYGPVWEQQARANAQAPVGSIIVFDDDGAIIRLLRKKLPGETILQVVSGNDFKVINPTEFHLNKTNADDYVQLFNQLKTQDTVPRYILYLTDSHHANQLDEAVIQEQLHHCFYSLFYLTQALMKQKLKQEIRVLCVSEGISDTLYPFTAAISGFAKTVLIEHPQFIYGIVDIPNLGEHSIDDLLAELNTKEVHARYDTQNIRWVEGYELIAPQLEAESLLKKGNVYLITGGLGGLGLIFARYLAQHYQARLVLVGRSKLKEQQHTILTELEQFGSEVLYINADVAQPKDLKRVMVDVKNRFGAINGIIHSAGVLRDAFILKKTSQQVSEVFSPKINGVIHLDAITQDEPLDFFMMFSSIASIFGNPGQCDYAYANGFLDEFAKFREGLRQEHRRAGKTIVINWPLWKEGGMQIDDAVIEAMERDMGLSPLTITQGILAFKHALVQSSPNLIVLYSSLKGARENGL